MNSFPFELTLREVLVECTRCKKCIDCAFFNRDEKQCRFKHTPNRWDIGKVEDKDEQM